MFADYVHTVGTVWVSIDRNWYYSFSFPVAVLLSTLQLLRFLD
jgi:hypothetical protein